MTATDLWQRYQKYLCRISALGLTLDARSPFADLWNVTVAQIAPVIPYLLLVLVLALRPTGLFGTRET